MREGHSDSATDRLIQSLHDRIDILQKDCVVFADWIRVCQGTYMAGNELKIEGFANWNEALAEHIRHSGYLNQTLDKYYASADEAEKARSDAQLPSGAIASPETGIGSGKPEGEA